MQEFPGLHSALTSLLPLEDKAVWPGQASARSLPYEDEDSPKTSIGLDKVVVEDSQGAKAWGALVIVCEVEVEARLKPPGRLGDMQ